MTTSLLVPLLLAALLGGLLAIGLRRMLAARASSAESHAVWSYILEAGVRPQMEARFNAVNREWPPRKSAIAQVLLEARLVAEAHSQQAAR